MTMPANLPPEYFRIEATLREARTPREKIEICEKILAVIPRHKGTEKLVALYKSKIAKLRDEMQKRPSTARRGSLFRIEKTGAGQIVLVGPPNSGKSSLIRALTGADVEVADYPFTTRSPSPHTMPFENIKIQLIDTPPVTAEITEVWFPEMIKTADGVLLVADLAAPDAAAVIEGILSSLKEKKVELTAATAATPPEKAPFLKRAILAANKCDLDEDGRRFEEFNILIEAPFERVSIAARAGIRIQKLQQSIFGLLRIVRAHSKIPGKKADMNSPYTLKIGSTVLDMARAVHKDFAENLKFARVWSKGGDIEGLRVNRDYALQDEDIIELHL